MKKEQMRAPLAEERTQRLSARELCALAATLAKFKRKDAVCKAQAHEPKAEIPAGLFGFAGDCTGVNLEQRDRMLFSPPHSV